MFDEDGLKREGTFPDSASKKRLCSMGMDAAMTDNDVTILALNDDYLLEVLICIWIGGICMRSIIHSINSAQTWNTTPDYYTASDRD